MSTFQMILFALGALFGVSALWDQIKTFIPSFKHDSKDSLAEVVVCWERLQDELKERGLNKAAAELTAIFPLFIEAVKEDTKPDQGA